MGMVTQKTRGELIRNLFPELPDYRFRQTEEAVFHAGWKSWNDVSNLPGEARAKLAAEVPWTSWTAADLHRSAAGDTFKTILGLPDGNRIETVLMKNSRGQWTVCVSSQVGCAMKCAFCATGTMGLLRNLTSDEIVDQVRYWLDFVASPEGPGSRISNIVFMGMGEPLANYENVKESIRTVLKRTDIGLTRITVSTSGMLPQLEALLLDQDWPDVRLAVSLHSADAKTRAQIMPSSYEGFLERLKNWALKYLAAKGGGRRHLTFEHIMLGNVNDSPEHAAKLADFAKSIGDVRVNLIPYNRTDAGFAVTPDARIRAFMDVLERNGITVTRRKSQGDDIAAACGQLVVRKS